MWRKRWHERNSTWPEKPANQLVISYAYFTMKVTVTIDTLIEVAHGRLTPKQLASVLLFRGVWLFGRYRGSIFILNEREHSEPLGRNERARALFLAEQYEKRTKQPGQRNGALGLVSLAVLRVLVCKFLNRTTGLRNPSTAAIAYWRARARKMIERPTSLSVHLALLQG